jgi:formylglycine-generating enzyme required for sulfatase activity
MPRIFISYSRVDNQNGDVRFFVERLRKGRPGDEIWWDEELRGGDVWWQEILSQIDRCDIFIYLLSNESVSSPYCQAEYFEARRLQKLILTVQVRGRTDIPEELGEIQYVDMTGVDKTDAFVALFAALAKLTSRIPRRRPRPLSPVPTPRPKKIPTVQEEKEAAPDAQTVTLPNLPQRAFPSKPASDSRFTTDWLVVGALIIIALVVTAVIIASSSPPSGNNTLTPTTAVALAASDAASPSQQPTSTETVRPSNTPIPTIRVTPTPQPSATPTLSETEYERAVQTQVSGIQTEAAQTAIAQVTATQAMATAFAQMTVYAQATDDANQTATAALWTATPTPDVRRTAEARLTETEQALIEQATATATLWTATPLPGYPGGAKITANSQWTAVRQIPNGVEMVLVPAGCFDMGSTDGDSDEQPVNKQCFDQPFWLDLTEVTNAQFAQFKGVAASQSTWTDPDRPRENITWFEARDYCQLRGGRLPTEAEWEYAARGPDDLKYPWGNDFVADNVVYSGNLGGQTADVGSRQGGASWVGALDMSGNVWEWVSTIYQPYPYDAADGREQDSNSTNVQRDLRGGSWLYDDGGFRATNRNWYNPNGFNYVIGVRCVHSYP